jgi:hypothetical protein
VLQHMVDGEICTEQVAHAIQAAHALGADMRRQPMMVSRMTVSELSAAEERRGMGSVELFARLVAAFDDGTLTSTDVD